MQHFQAQTLRMEHITNGMASCMGQMGISGTLLKESDVPVSFVNHGFNNFNE